MITSRFVDEAGALLVKHCPLASENAEMMDHIKGEIEDYDEKFGHPPNPELVLKLALPFENNLKTQTEAQKIAADREAIYARHSARISPQEPSDAN